MLWWGTLEGFCTSIDCSLENTTFHKPVFYHWISTVFAVAASPGSIRGEKNTQAETMPVLRSRKIGPQTFFDDFRDAHGAIVASFFDKIVFFPMRLIYSVGNMISSFKNTHNPE